MTDFIEPPGDVVDPGDDTPYRYADPDEMGPPRPGHLEAPTAEEA